MKFDAALAELNREEWAKVTLCVNRYRDPRWLPFLRKIGRAPEQVDAIRLDVKRPTT